MTIYAIVNDFLPRTHFSRIPGDVWTIMSQAAILQGGNPYFVPDFASRFEARMALAVRIGKLGKGIAPRFARRYVESVAPAVVFVAPDLLSDLRDEGMPWTPALSYDRSLALGKFQQIPFDGIASCECSLKLFYDDGFLETIHAPGLDGTPLEETVASVSRDNTLKTGDLLLIGLSASGPEVRPGCRVELSIVGGDKLGFNIR